MSLQNEYGQLDLVVRDSGTANICSRVQTIRFEPQGSIQTYGPNTRELTIDVNPAGGGGGEPLSNVLWEVGTSGTDNIKAKFASPVCDATGNFAVAHGQSSVAGGANSYAGGDSVTTTGDNTQVSGANNTITGISTNSSIISGSSNTISGAQGASIVGGIRNTIASAHNNTLIMGATDLTSTAADTVYTTHLEVGQTSAIGSIQRMSLTSNNWADGNCGNDTHIYFTPNDFKVSQVRAGSVNGAITDATGVGGGANPLLGTGTDNIVVNNAGSVFDCELLAMKLIPNGFTINTGTSSIFTQLSNSTNPYDVYQVFSLDLTTGTMIALTAATTPAAAPLSVTTIPHTAPALGDGITAVLVGINQDSTTSVPPPIGEALMSVAVGIKRV